MGELALTAIFWLLLITGWIVMFRVAEEVLGWGTGTGDIRTPWVLIGTLGGLPFIENSVAWLILSGSVLLCALVLDLRDLRQRFKDWRWRRSHPEEYLKQLEKMAAIEGDFEEIGWAVIGRSWAKQELARRRRRSKGTTPKERAIGIAAFAALAAVVALGAWAMVESGMR